VEKTDYRKMISTVVRLLSGQRDGLIRDTEREMNEAAANLRFERAAHLRDQISGIREVISRQKFRVNAVDNNNLIAIYPAKESNSVELFFIKKGVLEEQREMSFTAQPDDEFVRAITPDIEQIFFRESERRREPMSKLEVDAMNIIARWLYRHRNDQSLVYIRKKRNKAETVISAAEKVKEVIQLLISV
jgi:excinuclease ABC subunit C